VSTIVIDASVAIKWAVEESDADKAMALRKHRCVAPDLMVAEYTNILWKKVTRGQLSAAQAELAATSLHLSGIKFHPMQDLAAPALKFSIALAHPAYDCLYLALAEHMGCHFVTADAKLCRELLAHDPLARIVELDKAAETLRAH